MLLFYWFIVKLKKGIFSRLFGQYCQKDDRCNLHLVNCKHLKVFESNYNYYYILSVRNAFLKFRISCIPKKFAFEANDMTNSIWISNWKLISSIQVVIDYAKRNKHNWVWNQIASMIECIDRQKCCLCRFKIFFHL